MNEKVRENHKGKQRRKHMKKPECYSGGRGLKSFLGKTQQINKNEKEKGIQNYRTHGHLLTVDITVTAHWVKRVTGNRANSDSQWGWLYICLDF